MTGWERQQTRKPALTLPLSGRFLSHLGSPAPTPAIRARRKTPNNTPGNQVRDRPLLAASDAAKWNSETKWPPTRIWDGVRALTLVARMIVGNRNLRCCMPVLGHFFRCVVQLIIARLKLSPHFAKLQKLVTVACNVIVPPHVGLPPGLVVSACLAAAVAQTMNHAHKDDETTTCPDSPVALIRLTFSLCAFDAPLLKNGGGVIGRSRIGHVVCV
jgi:hypothetical protein